jgi:hypothetical protein
MYHLSKNLDTRKKKGFVVLFFAITWWQVPFVIDSLAEEVARSNLGSGAQELLCCTRDLWRFARAKETTLVWSPERLENLVSPLLLLFLLLLVACESCIPDSCSEETDRLEEISGDRRSRGKKVVLGDGSFQVHFSFVAIAGIGFFRMGEFTARHLQNCV